MGTPNAKPPSQTQSNLQRLANGRTATSLSILNSHIVLGTSMYKAQVITPLKACLALYAAVVNATQARHSVVSARTNAQTAMHSFCASLVASVKPALGPTNARQLPSLDIPLPATPTSATEAMTPVASTPTPGAATPTAAS